MEAGAQLLEIFKPYGFKETERDEEGFLFAAARISRNDWINLAWRWKPRDLILLGTAWVEFPSIQRILNLCYMIAGSKIRKTTNTVSIRFDSLRYPQRSFPWNFLFPPKRGVYYSCIHLSPASIEESRQALQPVFPERAMAFFNQFKSIQDVDYYYNEQVHRVCPDGFASHRLDRGIIAGILCGRTDLEKKIHHYSQNLRLAHDSELRAVFNLLSEHIQQKDSAANRLLQQEFRLIDSSKKV